MAGHSKWANIQHRKGRQDAVRSKLFSKISKEITVAAKMGDPDVDKNPRLRLAVKEARSNSVPKDVIERAIKKSQASDNTSYEDIRYEGYASGGVAIIVETMTDNKNRSAAEVRSTFSKYNGNLGVSSCVKHNFKKVGIISYNKSISTFEDFFDYCASLDVDDVTENENDFVLETNLDSFNTILQKLENKFSIPKFSEIEWKPLNFIDISDEDSAKVLIKLLETLEDLDDVQSVSSNFNINDSLMDKII